MNFELNLSNTFDSESVTASEPDFQWKPMKKFKVTSQFSAYLKSAVEMNEHLNFSQDSGKIIVQLFFLSAIDIIVISSNYENESTEKHSDIESGTSPSCLKRYEESWIRII